MCNYEDTVEIIISQKVRVDKCIAQEILWLNSHGVRTENSCCGHGQNEPAAIIRPSSSKRAKELGYNPVFLQDVGNWEIILKSSEARNCPAANALSPEYDCGIS